MRGDLDLAKADQQHPTDAATRQSLFTDKSTWRVARAERFGLVVDAADYFRVLRKIFLGARQQLMLIGWDFDPRIALVPDEQGRGQSLGHYLLALAHAKPVRDIDILRWNFGGLKHFLVPSIVTMILRWKATRSISFRLDSAHPAGCSHHQKVAVFDDHLAVCGGIDVAA